MTAAQAVDYAMTSQGRPPLPTAPYAPSCTYGKP